MSTFVDDLTPKQRRTAQSRAAAAWRSGGAAHLV